MQEAITAGVVAIEHANVKTMKFAQAMKDFFGIQHEGTTPTNDERKHFLGEIKALDKHDRKYFTELLEFEGYAIIS